MVHIDKFIIGIRPASKIFRISSVVGQIIDSILSERGTNHLDEKYYEKISSNKNLDTYRLENDSLGNILTIDLENVIFIKDYYEVTKEFDFSEIFLEFKQIWNAIDKFLKLKDIRRIGMAAEHQIRGVSNNLNKKLLDSMTTVKEINHPAKFHLRYENRYPTIAGAAPDIEKSDLINIIYHYYDSATDTDHPNEDSYNANIDVQRYYSPLLKSNIVEEVNKLHNVFSSHKKNFDVLLSEKGLHSNEKKKNKD